MAEQLAGSECDASSNLLFRYLTPEAVSLFLDSPLVSEWSLVAKTMLLRIITCGESLRRRGGSRLAGEAQMLRTLMHIFSGKGSPEEKRQCLLAAVDLFAVTDFWTPLKTIIEESVARFLKSDIGNELEALQIASPGAICIVKGKRRAKKVDLERNIDPTTCVQLLRALFESSLVCNGELRKIVECAFTNLFPLLQGNFNPTNCDAAYVLIAHNLFEICTMNALRTVCIRSAPSNEHFSDLLRWVFNQIPVNDSSQYQYDTDDFASPIKFHDRSKLRQGVSGTKQPVLTSASEEDTYPLTAAQKFLSTMVLVLADVLICREDLHHMIGTQVSYLFERLLGDASILMDFRAVSKLCIVLLHFKNPLWEKVLIFQLRNMAAQCAEPTERMAALWLRFLNTVAVQSGTLNMSHVLRDALKAAVAEGDHDLKLEPLIRSDEVLSTYLNDVI